MRPADPALSLAERVDAACDRFESEWRAGRRPRIEDYLAAAPASDREALRQALLTVELELRGGGAADTAGTRSSVRAEDRPAPVATGPYAGGPGAAPAAIGRFVIRGTLGSGAFGLVYRAFDPQLGREVAVKVPLEAAVRNDAERARFLKEARAAATINHPNVCQIHEVGEADGRPYIVMALVPGQSLAHALKTRKEPLPAKQAALVVRKVALALAAAHARGIVHRDLKPANVMFDRERKDVIVMDFGLARGPRAGDAHATRSGVIMGTPAYMSPEQARGDSKAVGPPGDIFSLGVILYEMLTGRRPFTGTVGEVIGKILHVEPDPPAKLRPDVDPRLADACQKAMAKDPARRFGSMKEFAAALAECFKAPAAPTSGSAPTREEAAAADESLGLQQVFAALSEERKQTAAAVEAAVRKARTPWWVWVASSALAGLIAVLGIVFFARTPTPTVLINVGVDLSDQSLRFVLDDKPISAEALARPVELAVGDHELVVWRGEQVVKRMRFSVRGGRTPTVEYKEEPTPPSPPKREVVWTPLLRSADELIEGETINKNNNSRYARFEDGVLLLHGTWSQFRPKLAGKNYILRAQVLHFSGHNLLFKVRYQPGGFGGYDVLFNDPGRNPDLPAFVLGKAMPDKSWHLLADSMLRPGPDFPCDYAVAVYGNEVSAYLNGVQVIRATDAEAAEGEISIVGGPGGARLRDIRGCVLDGTGLTPDDVFPQPDDPAARRELAREFLTAELATKNLLRNGSFEAADTSLWAGESSGGRAGRWRIVPGQGRGSSTAVRIDSPDPDAVGVKQTVKVRPRKRYLLSGWVKTEGVRATLSGTHAAYLHVEGGCERENTNLEGTNDWTYQAVVFQSGQRTSVSVAARLANVARTATGTAWFDDLCVVELPDAPAPAAPDQ